MTDPNFQQLYTYFQRSDGVCIDTRQSCENKFFIAIRGEQFDGNHFAKQAIDRGVKYAVVDDQSIADAENNIFFVENTLSFLQQLASHHRKQFDIPVLGITGTNGKTTTKELIHAVLSKKYAVLATQGNLNNHIGVPLTVLQLTDKHQIAVIEMGASRPGDIEELCEIADPTHGLITNIGEAHLEGFKTLESIIETKRELYKYVAQRYGTLFVDTGQSTLNKMIPHTVNKITYRAWNRIWKRNNVLPIQRSSRLIDDTADDQEGRRSEHKLNAVEQKQLENAILAIYKAGAHLNGILYDANPYMTFQFLWSPIQIQDDGRSSIDLEMLPTKLFGEHNVQNCMASIAVGKFFNVSKVEIMDAIEYYRPANNRSQVLQTNTNTLFVDCYNANPSSMSIALKSFGKMFVQEDGLHDNSYIVLGDMLELGEQSQKKHAQILKEIENLNLKGITVGENFTHVKSSNIEHQFETVEQAIEFIKENPINNKWILLKGSHGVQLERLIEHL